MLHLKDVVAFDKLGQLDEFVLLAPHEVSFEVLGVRDDVVAKLRRRH